MPGMEPTEVDVDELIEFWTLLDEDRELLAGKRGSTALGFALLLKHYSRHGRFRGATGIRSKGATRACSPTLDNGWGRCGINWGNRKASRRMRTNLSTASQ